MEKEYSTRSIFHQYINTVEIRVPYAPPTIQCRDDSGVHDFNRAMTKFSIGMAQDWMVDILIIKVRVKTAIIGFETFTDKRHHGISADILARKWGIGLD